jgi:hypothetical protein
MGIGSFGRIRVFEDFLGCAPASMGAVPTADVSISMGNVAFTCLNEGSNTMVVDEPGGILQITTDVGDNDNAVLWAGPFKPSDGGVTAEFRFKVADITTCAVFAGWTETLDQTGTPVCPAEFSGTTLTINGTGGVAGMLHDSDADTADWRAVAGDGGAVASGLTTSNGTRANAAPVNDEWDIVRIELDVNGDAKLYHDGKLIDDVAACVTASDVGYVCLMIENRSAAASVMEVDLFFAEGGRDWTV